MWKSALEMRTELLNDALLGLLSVSYELGAATSRDIQNAVQSITTSSNNVQVQHVKSKSLESRNHRLSKPKGRRVWPGLSVRFLETFCIRHVMYFEPP